MPNPPAEQAGARLRKAIEESGLSLSEVARQLKCTHPAILDWLDGNVPSEPFRDAIATWTAEWPEGPIAASAWGLTPREDRLATRLAEVQPFPFTPPQAA